LKHYTKYIRSYWLLAVISIVCVSLEAVCDLFQPKLMSRLVDNGVMTNDINAVVQTGLIMFTVAGLGAVFALTRNIASSVASQNFGRELRGDLFKKIHSLPASEIDRFSGASLITRMTNDVTQIQNFANMMMRIFFKAPIICIGAVIMSATLNIRAVFLIIPVAAGVFFVIIMSIRLSYPRFAQMQKAIDSLNTVTREYLAGIRLVKAFRRFDAEAQRFDTANENLFDNSASAGRVISALQPFMPFLSQLGIAGIIFLGARWVAGGVMNIGAVMAFVIYMQQIMQSFNMIANWLSMAVRVKSSYERVTEVLDADNTDAAPADAVRFDAAAPVIEFKNVTFAYQGSTGEAALSNVSFSVKKGQTLGVIGTTGAGKTTLASLLMRFYAPTSGEIKISGVPVGDIPRDVLYAKIAIAPQNLILFTGTIKENIIWGRPDATDSEVINAARSACADDFITEQPHGYDTFLGQGGVNLSGGQKQRLSITRALIREPDILLLDDCTSALDVFTEAKLRQNIDGFISGMTSVIITQRIAAAQACDTILVLDGGMAAGAGSHGELMKSCAVYQDIYRSQIGDV